MCRMQLDHPALLVSPETSYTALYATLRRAVSCVPL